MAPKHLRVWAGLPGSDDGPPRLGLAQTLYSPPNPDSTRKKCQNCLFWLLRERCFLHDTNVIATADSVCGYHVYGEPFGADVPRRENVMVVTPELSGLEQVPDGTSCESCAHYQATPGSASGVCQALYDDPEMAGDAAIHSVVQALGCCCAWTAQEN